jgi:hypothetical protein
MDHVARFVNSCTGRCEDSASPWRQHTHALILEHPERGLVQALNLVL